LDGRYFDEMEAFYPTMQQCAAPCCRSKTASDICLIRRPVVNHVVMTDDVLLPWLDYTAVDEDDIQRQADSYAAAAFRI
jgi:hypothetical protein